MLEKEINQQENDLKDIKRSIMFFMEYSEDIIPKYDSNLKHLLKTITAIRIKSETKNSYVLTIETHTPGKIIGKGGQVINALKVFLNNDTTTDKIIEIDLQECKMWHNLYLVND